MCQFRDGVASLAFLFVVSAVQVGQAATYYVGTSGSDSRSASQATNRSTPWRNIRYAVNQASGGDQVVVLAGTYCEQVTSIDLFMPAAKLCCEQKVVKPLVWSD
ncbi:hypothetical protein [Rubripirellula reticaptiva]|uniref:DUF1565 domain-containing protein n=1 Tax=Rubripirellula reticaptiva TaxID=2528013 RepID=A0A5C6EHY7_9BACT|nr:hypothetical protein [Rubripirellula reticaptiva]TWU48428.1 hypothetical protein Poly59_52760 [Rubripirellula reticaptiva]